MSPVALIVMAIWPQDSGLIGVDDQDEMAYRSFQRRAAATEGQAARGFPVLIFFADPLSKTPVPTSKIVTSDPSSTMMK
jgi:hypothetical protein